MNEKWIYIESGKYPYVLIAKIFCNSIELYVALQSSFKHLCIDKRDITDNQEVWRVIAI